jgi:hypothetical protein
MQGYINVGSDVTTFEKAGIVAEVAPSFGSLNLRIAVRRDDHGGFLGIAHGTISCSALSQDPLLITHGSVNFFTVDKDVSDANNLICHFDIMSIGGETFHFHGYKCIDPSMTLSLYSTITDSTGSTAAQGS